MKQPTQKYIVPSYLKEMLGQYQVPIYIRRRSDIKRNRGFLGINASELETRIEELIVNV